MVSLVASVCSLIFGIAIGWVVAHSTVSTECDKLGAFYFGSKTYLCEVKK